MISSLSRFGRDRIAVKNPSANFSGLATGNYLLDSNHACFVQNPTIAQL